LRHALQVSRYILLPETRDTKQKWLQHEHAMRWRELLTLAHKSGNAYATSAGAKIIARSAISPYTMTNNERNCEKEYRASSLSAASSYLQTVSTRTQTASTRRFVGDLDTKCCRCGEGRVLSRHQTDAQDEITNERKQ